MADQNSELIIDPKDIYREDRAQQRTLNEILYQIPTIHTAAIGAIFTASFSEIGKPVAIQLYILAGVLSFISAGTVWRLRLALNSCLDRIQSLEGSFGYSIRGRSKVPSVVKMYTGLLMTVGSAFLIHALIALIQ